jgi:excisionase family DNA binding protein
MTNSKVPRLLTIPETAEHSRVSTKTVRRWIDCGDLHAHRPGRKILISEEDLLSFLNRCRS